MNLERVVVTGVVLWWLPRDVQFFSTPYPKLNCSGLALVRLWFSIAFELKN